MPRKCPYRIDLSDAERARLEVTARKYTSSYRDVVRAKIVLYAAAGLDNDEIAARLDTPRQIVSKWRKRFFRERLRGLEERSRTGRPALFSPPASSSPLRPWPASCRTSPRCRCRAGACRRSAARSSSAAWWPRSGKLPCGAGSPRMQSVRGRTAPGSSRAIRLSSAKPSECWICITGNGKENP